MGSYDNEEYLRNPPHGTSAYYKKLEKVVLGLIEEKPFKNHGDILEQISKNHLLNYFPLGNEVGDVLINLRKKGKLERALDDYHGHYFSSALPTWEKNLYRSWDVYQSDLSQMLQRHEGDYVAIRGKRILGYDKDFKVLQKKYKGTDKMPLVVLKVKDSNEMPEEIQKIRGKMRKGSF